MKHLDPRDKELFSAVEEILFTYADRFSLPLNRVLPMKSKNTALYYGQCSESKTIRISLRRNGARVVPYNIVDTMAHELAHLSRWRHTRKWYALYATLVFTFSREGVYDRIRKLCRKS